MATKNVTTADTTAPDDELTALNERIASEAAAATTAEARAKRAESGTGQGD